MGSGRTLIENGILIDPANNVQGEFDLLIEGREISARETRGGFASLNTDVERIDASGCWVVPGLIDLHVHLREPGFEWKETILSGSRAAIAGGYTTICCMPNTNPVNDSAQVTEFILEKARSANLCNVLPIGSVTLGLKGKQLSPLSELRHAGCAAFSDDGEPVFDSGVMRRALEWCRMLDVPICCHEEDKALTCGGCMNESALSVQLGLKGMPTIAEDVMVARDIELARYTKSRIHICHVSTARSIELIRRAKNDGIAVTCEVTPHHLLLDESSVADYNTSAKMSPPLRTQEDVQALRQGLVDETVDCIASDHAPHEVDSKRREFSEATFGILGLQTSLSLTLELVELGLVSQKRAIELLSLGAARAFGLALGTLTTGAAADVVVVDPHIPWEFRQDSLLSISANSPFLNRRMIGKARDVWVSGKPVLRGGKNE